jgi:hypothetical protein
MALTLQSYIAPFGPVNKQGWGLAYPNSWDGTLWIQGDVVWNTSCIAAGYPGWICVSGGMSGSAGVWKAMAAVAS